MRKIIIFNIIYLIFCIIDTIFFILIKILPNKNLYNLINNLSIVKGFLKILPIKKELIENYTQKLLFHRSSKSRVFSTCLSRSMLGRLVLSLFGISNQMHLGMTLLKNGKKQPHAWLTNSKSSKYYTEKYIDRPFTFLTKI